MLLQPQQLNEVCYGCTKLNITHYNHRWDRRVQYAECSSSHQWKRYLNRINRVNIIYLCFVAGRCGWCCILWTTAYSVSDSLNRESPIFSQSVFSLWPQINSHIHRAHKWCALHNEPYVVKSAVCFRCCSFFSTLLFIPHASINYVKTFCVSCALCPSAPIHSKWAHSNQH